MTIVLLKPSKDGERVELSSPIAMPEASTFLWNRLHLLQINCRGYVVSQHLQPEPAKYSRGPMPEQRTFMLPEHKYYAHHPGRFVYVKDEDSGELFSIPHEPVRSLADDFVFSVGKSDVEWRILRNNISFRLRVSLPVDDVVELWTLEIVNTGTSTRRLSVYPYFSIGYMSWMNQSARYSHSLGGIVANSVTPYQKLEDYAYVDSLKDKTFLLHDVEPDASDASQSVFEGEGGLHNPDCIRSDSLSGSDADYETPVAVLQYRIAINPGEKRRFNFLFGPARDEAEIIALRQRYLSASSFAVARDDHNAFLQQGVGCLRINTPDQHLDNFVNHWLDRQVFYHGSTNRLTTDPQTRNYLQDNMGMVYVQPTATRAAIVFALAQQKADGALPDGILLREGAELKYINQVPHADHSAWLPVLLEAYLNETNDYELLNESVNGQKVSDRVSAAMQSLIRNRDDRGLCLIAQGDWCDPMNMVGHRGKGVSSWLSMATVHALRVWASINRQAGNEPAAIEFVETANEITAAIQEYFWDANWFSRGITDANIPFGVARDDEGKIFLNAQSWAIIADVANADQRSKIVASLKDHLDTPFGMMTLAPAYTHMREDVGRLTQKYPGTTENGSVYNHAATFYICALFKSGDADGAFEQLRRLIPGPAKEDYLCRGQLPVFIPNYYRGAIHQFPRTAGRSSQLFNTGAVSWLYRMLVEDLFGLKGVAEGLHIEPNLPSAWPDAAVTRRFRGAQFEVKYRRDRTTVHTRVLVDDKAIEGQVITGVEAGRSYKVDVILGDEQA